MPEIYVYAIEGRTKEQKKALIQDITAARYAEALSDEDASKPPNVDF